MQSPWRKFHEEGDRIQKSESRMEKRLEEESVGAIEIIELMESNESME